MEYKAIEQDKEIDEAKENSEIEQPLSVNIGNDVKNKIDAQVIKQDDVDQFSNLLSAARIILNRLIRYGKVILHCESIFAGKRLILIDLTILLCSK